MYGNHHCIYNFPCDKPNLSGDTLMQTLLIQAAQYCLDSYRTTATYDLKDIGVQIHIHQDHCCFRGTDERLDWKWNLNSEFKYVQGGLRIHSGYQRLFMSLLRSGIPFYSYKVFSGHSMGGVLASMFSQHQDTTAISFGAPRYLGQESRIKKLTRVYSTKDIVPRLPLWISGMKHPNAYHEIKLNHWGHGMQTYWQSCVNK